MANLRHVAFITPRLQTLGINHFGFTVDKLEDVMEKLDDSIEHGVNPQNGRPAEMRIIDPWGNNVDLSSRGSLGRDEFSLPGVRHVVVQADGPEACCRFYTDSCGLTSAGVIADGSLLLSAGGISLALAEKKTIDRGRIQYFGLQVDGWSAMQARFADVGEVLPALRQPRPKRFT